MIVKKYGLTGTSNKFRIIIVPLTGSAKLLDFTTQYSALHQIDETRATRDEFTDGSKDKTPHYINLEWVLVWDGFLNTDDGLKIQETKNSEFDECEIYIQPDIDVLKSYKVQIIEDKRKYESYHNLLNSAKRYMLAFENKDPIVRYDNWLDPSVTVYQTIDEFDFV